MHYFLKNYVLGLMTPTALFALLILTGVVLVLKNKHRLSRSFLIVGTLLLFTWSLTPLTELMIRQYEGQFPAFEIDVLNDQQRSEIPYVVVLSGGYAPNEHQPLSSQLGSFTLTRLIEGIRLHKALPNSRLVVSGASDLKFTEAEAMQKLALSLGVAADKIIIETQSRNTHQHPRYIAPIVGKNPFIVVTSALHMPRAMGQFRGQGLYPMAAPTHFLYLGEYRLFNRPPYPRGENLFYLDLFFTEVVGTMVAWLKGELK